MRVFPLPSNAARGLPLVPMTMTNPVRGKEEDILGRIEGDYVATALRQCPDPSFVAGPHFVVVHAGRLGRVRICCERIRSRRRSVWFWFASRADRVGTRRR